MAGWSICEHGGSKENCSGNNNHEKKNNDELIDVCFFKNDDDDDDVKWSDCDDKLRCLFDQVLMVLLRGVYAKNGIRPMPALLGDGKSVDLFKLFCLVRDRGGFRAVSGEMFWGLVAEKFGFEYKLCASLKLIYFKYLDELDQWLDRISKDSMNMNGGYECGGNLGLLSLELEKRFRGFTSVGKEVLMEEADEIGYDEICKNIHVALKETLHLPDSEMCREVSNGVSRAIVDDGFRLCYNGFDGEGNLRAVNNSRKRKRDMFAEMLSWMSKVAKNPCHPSVGGIPGCPKSKENGGNDFWSVMLSVRDARLNRRYTDSNDEQSPSDQKKIKMHPSMYEDKNFPDHDSAEGLRCSKRISSSMKSPPCHCCKPGSVNQCKLESPVKFPLENGCHKQENVKVDLPAAKIIDVQVVDDLPVEKNVLVGPRFQVEVPIWTGVASESDSKWLGTQIWVPDSQEEKSSPQIELGKGRSESCKCAFPGSVECYRFHIAENRIKLRHELGLAFYHWKFDRMGEEVSLSWSVEEEKRFKQIIGLHKPHLGRSFFPRKRRMDLVSYYYNVYLVNRRSYQNRVTPKDIDSDDDETEFGSVSEAFGCKAIKVRRSEPPLTCHVNEFFFDLE